MMLLRRLSSAPPPRERKRTGREAAIAGHVPCNLQQHGPDCQICYCKRGHAEHMIPIPMPDWFKAQFGNVKIGRAVDE